MSAPSYKAAWLTNDRAKLYIIKEVPYTVPSPSEIIIKNHAVAINPADWIMQDFAIFPLLYLTTLSGESGILLVKLLPWDLK